MANVSFDLRCESVTYCFVISLVLLGDCMFKDIIHCTDEHDARTDEETRQTMEEENAGSDQVTPTTAG